MMLCIREHMHVTQLPQQLSFVQVLRRLLWERKKRGELLSLILW